MKEWFRRNKWIALGSLALVIIFPILLNYLIFSWRAPGVNGDWMDFLGSYLGAIIGVVVVYLTAIMQLQAQSKESKENRMFQVRPYLRAETIEYVPDKVEQIHFSIITPSFDYIPTEFANNFGSGQFKLANIGLGTAVDIQFKVDVYMHRYTHNNSALIVKEESEFNIYTFLHDTQKFEMVVTYCDMLGNSFEQKIEFISEMISDSDGYHLQVKKTHPPKLNGKAP